MPIDAARAAPAHWRSGSPATMIQHDDGCLAASVKTIRAGDDGSRGLMAKWVARESRAGDPAGVEPYDER